MKVAQGFRWSCGGILLLLAGMAACNGSKAESSAVSAPPDAIPRSVSIDGASVELGGAISRLRSATDVTGFRISRFPITVGRYQQCIDHGYCQPPEHSTGACESARRADGDGPTFGSEAPEDAPVTCLSVVQASKYCRWVGGRLPTVAELSLAARGPKVKRFAWGDAPPTCERSWRLVFAPDLPGSCCGVGCADLSARLVGKHPAGASPFGVEDVLLTHAELATPVAGTNVGACGAGTNACYVTGMVPGALDWFLPVPEESDRPAKFAAGFRCVFEEEGR